MSEYICNSDDKCGMCELYKTAEEIVRCRDCKYLDTTRGSLVPRAGIYTATCTRLSAQIPWKHIDSGFCAWGNRVEQ